MRSAHVRPLLVLLAAGSALGGPAAVQNALPDWSGVWAMQGGTVFDTATGREYPDADALWPTYSGASIGHWEGDTLVFTTISLKESRDGDVIVDRTGLVLSDAARGTTRIRKVDDTTLEARECAQSAPAPRCSRSPSGAHRSAHCSISMPSSATSA